MAMATVVFATPGKPRPELSSACCIEFKDDFSSCVAACKLLVCCANLFDWIDGLDRNDQSVLGDEVGQFGEDAAVVAFGLAGGVNTVLLGGSEVDDGVDPVGFDAEAQSQVDLAVAVVVDRTSGSVWSAVRH